MNQNFKHEFFSDECWVVNMRAEWTNKYYNIENYVLEDYTIDLIKRFFQSDAKPVFGPNSYALFTRMSTSWLAMISVNTCLKSSSL